MTSIEGFLGLRQDFRDKITVSQDALFTFHMDIGSLELLVGRPAPCTLNQATTGQIVPAAFIDSLGDKVPVFLA